MPAYNFKKQFAEAVASGRKTCTIREVRKKRPTRVGDRLFLFTGMRQRGCRLLKDIKCSGLMPIEILTNPLAATVSIAGLYLTPTAITRLAKRDGFSSAHEFVDFFADNYGPKFTGELIEWNA